ncbi:MIP/aquaporin family protein [Kineococcus aurantiacus]|uniref:Glycerol uptake facilitator protein n=1 Tax=Kineococcus aurantiacus TaxID=37633 RepID=A0A7Y9J275_9ACTN|nr:MIP/aquaporin family protein [Kineococcus aurantiacus]NYD23844.1 glycerol uptake facilitator protein [Kineococcus aurantiacus]
MSHTSSAAAPPRRVAPRTPTLTGELLAEFAGTAVLILFGVGVVAQVVAGQNGGADSIHWAWGLGVTFGIYVAGRTTGAHLNPAVTIALAVFQGFSWKKVLPYSVAQFLGAFVAALIVRWVYNDAIMTVDPGTTSETQGIFATLPGTGVSIGTAFLDQVVGTAILVFLIFAISQAKAMPPAANLAPFIIGLVVVGIGMAWGSNAGYAINPARDFGPRVAEFLTGYSDAMKTPGGQLYFWVPIVAPVIGALIGGGLYRVLVERHLPDPEAAEPEGRVHTDD